VRCLVTGGAGFIGSNLVDALVARGDEVVVLDDLSTGKLENLRGAIAAGARLERADVADTERVAALFKACEPQLVFHLAAQIDVRRSVADPATDATVNVLGTLAVLEAARTSGTRWLVLSSTGGGLYGDAERLPTPEDHPIHPLAPYGQSKLAAEGYCALYERLHGLSTVALRYGNVYGPRQDAHGEAGVVAIFCGQLISGQAPTVFGDGGQTRVGSGWAAPARFATERAGEVRRSCLDVDRARRARGWSAEVKLPDGLRTTLASIPAP
jgi:UDP-glucose 4-epimerase